MASPYNLPDYVTKYFEYKQLEKINGKLSIESILQLFRQVNQNTQCTCITLGGGQLCYLSLIICPTVYNSITNSTPFERAIDPGPFAINSPPAPTAINVSPNSMPLLLTSPDMHTQKAIHNINLRIYNKCQAVELALRNQITDAVESDYLSALRNAVKDMIPNNIPSILTLSTNNVW